MPDPLSKPDPEVPGGAGLRPCRPGFRPARSVTDAAALHSTLTSFISSAVQPALLDPGEEPLLLVPGHWSLSTWNNRLILQAWDARRNLVRKILALKSRRRDRLTFLTERFHKPEAELEIADLAAPGGHDLQRRASRIAFCERFRLMLAREWPEWQIVEVSADANLEASLSTSYARALLKLGATGMAVMAAAPDTTACAGIVPSALIWLDHLRRRERTLAIGRLLLYVPLGQERDAAFRVTCLDPVRLYCRLYAFDARDRVGLIDLTDVGNIESTLPPCGLTGRRRLHLENGPEAWLESQVRAHPESIDASLCRTPIYGQVPVFAAGDRGVIDLLGIDHTGRLVVIELKATADLQLPFQALDYWLRVRKHLDAGDFERFGYFAGHVISREPPRILLVAPALEFHSTSETMLESLAPMIEVTRIGLAAGWRDTLRVMFRLRGSEHP